MVCVKPLGNPFFPLFIFSLLGHSRSCSQTMALSHSAHVTSSKGEWPQILGNNRQIHPSENAKVNGNVIYLVLTKKSLTGAARRKKYFWCVSSRLRPHC